VLSHVQLEAVLWGFGTAIGELPPYFVAKGHRETGTTNIEIKEAE